MARPIVILMRHGLFDGLDEGLAGRCPVELSDAGRRQARATAEQCQALALSGLWCSPQRRAVETAAIVARQLGLRLELDAAFDEVDYGQWTGRSFASLADDPEWRLFNEERHLAYIPGGETLCALSARVARGLEGLRQRHLSGPAVVVTHAEVIRAAVLMANAQSWIHWADYQPPPASLTLLVWHDGWRSLAVGRDGPAIAQQIADAWRAPSQRRVTSTQTA